MTENQDVFEEHMTLYQSKSFLTRKVFWNRIKTSIKFAKIRDDSIVLDIGCNTGHLLITIRKSNTNCECWGIDVEPKISTLKIKNCKFHVADVKKLPFQDDYFTVIFALDVLEHVKDVDVAIKEIHRILKPNGSLVLCGPTESWFYRFCRFLQFGIYSKNVKSDKPGFRGEIDYHHYTIYDLENKFQSHGFKKLKLKSIPHFLPTLFRVTLFKK